MTDDIYMDDFNDPVSACSVITLGVDWMVRGYVKENRLQDNLMGSWIRVGDIPELLTQVYSLRLCPATEDADSIDILSCEAVEVMEGAYLLAPLPMEGESPFAAAATEGVWLQKGWNPAWRSLWLGVEVCLRANEDDAFHRVQEIAAPCGMAYSKESRICSYRCAGYRRWVKPAGEEQPVVQVESPRMMRLVLSGWRWKESSPPCAIRLARTFSQFNAWGVDHSAFAVDVYGRCISEAESLQYPPVERYSSMAASYCEEM